MSKFIEFQTRDELKVYLNKEQIAALEEVPASARAETYTKVFIMGYSYSIPGKAEEVIKKLQGN